MATKVTKEGLFRESGPNPTRVFFIKGGQLHDVNTLGRELNTQDLNTQFGGTRLGASQVALKELGINNIGDLPQLLDVDLKGARQGRGTFLTPTQIKGFGTPQLGQAQTTLNAQPDPAQQAFLQAAQRTGQTGTNVPIGSFTPQEQVPLGITPANRRQSALQSIGENLGGIQGQVNAIQGQITGQAGGQPGGLTLGAGGQAPTSQAPSPIPSTEGGQSPTTPIGTSGNPALQDLETQLQAIQQTLLASLTPSEKELALEEQLQNIITSAELGIEKVRTQPIATPFITGQSAAVQRQAALSAQPLQTQLAGIQSRRQSAVDVASVQLEFAESRFGRVEDRITREQKLARETAANQKEESQEVKDEIFQIAGLAAQGGASQDEITTITNVPNRNEALRLATPFLQEQADTGAGTGDEIEIKTGQGISLSTKAVLDGISSVSTLTPSVRQEVEAELSQLGFGSDTPPSWFREPAEQSAQASLTPQELQRLWIEFRDTILSGQSQNSETSSSSSTGRIKFSDIPTP